MKAVAFDVCILMLKVDVMCRCQKCVRKVSLFLRLNELFSLSLGTFGDMKFSFNLISCKSHLVDVNECLDIPYFN
jgi:hypothetical protein